MRENRTFGSDGGEEQSFPTHIFKQSVAINGFGNLITINTVGLGRSNGRANFEAEIKENTGMQTLITDEHGSIEVRPLDSFTFPQRVKMIKIDVEHMELDVICGAKKTISENRPLIYVESTGSDFRQVMEELAGLNYLYWDTFNATPTHLFFPIEEIEAWWQAGQPSKNINFILHRMDTRFKSSILLLLEAQKTIGELLAKSNSSQKP
jgi:FkbM family methyltransferase